MVGRNTRGKGRGRGRGKGRGSDTPADVADTSIPITAPASTSTPSSTSTPMPVNQGSVPPSQGWMPPPGWGGQAPQGCVPPSQWWMPPQGWMPTPGWWGQTPHGCGVQPPPQGWGVLPPSQGCGVQPPPQGCEVQPPPQGWGVQPPPQGWGVQPPHQGWGFQPPPQGCGFQPPPQGWGVQPPPQGWGIQPPTQGWGVQPPTQGCGVQPLTQGCVVQPPPQVCGVQSPPQGRAPVPPLSPSHPSHDELHSGSQPDNTSGVGGSRGSSTEPRIPLRKDGLNGWLPYNIGIQKVTMTIRKLYDRPIEYFGKLSKDEKIRWYDAWKEHFIINPKDDGFFFKAFKTRAAHRLQDMYTDIRMGRDPNPRWMSDRTLKAMHEIWQSDKFKNRSAKAKANRASVKGGSLHCGGSTTIASTKERMARELGRLPTQAEVFKQTHTRKGEKTLWVDPRSGNTYTDFTQRLEEARTRQTQNPAKDAVGDTDVPPIDEDRLWLETIGGSKKNRIYGLGTYYVGMSSDPKSGVEAAGSTNEEVRQRVHELNVALQAQAQKLQEQEQQILLLRQAMKEPAALDNKILMVQAKRKKDKKKMKMKVKSLVEALFRQMQAGGSSMPTISFSSSSSSDDESEHNSAIDKDGAS